MLFFLILLLACMPLNMLSADCENFGNIDGSAFQSIGTRNLLPSFLTPSYYQQIISDSYNWAGQNSKEIFVTAAITGIARLTLGKRAGYTVLGAGVARLWFKTEMDKFKREQIAFNTELEETNKANATVIAKIRETTSAFVARSYTNHTDLLARLNKQESTINEINEQTLPSLTAQVGTLKSLTKDNSKELEAINKGLSDGNAAVLAKLNAHGNTINAIQSELPGLTNQTKELRSLIGNTSGAIAVLSADVGQIKEGLTKTELFLVELVKEHKGQTKNLEEIKTNINSLRQETKVITAGVANHIITETKKLVQNPSYCLQPFNAEQALKNFYPQRSLGSAVARGCFKPSSSQSKALTLSDQ